MVFNTIFQKIRLLLLGESRPIAHSPREFKFEDWKIALQATKDALGAKRVGLMAAGSAYFATLAFFPLVAAIVAIASFTISQEGLDSVVKSLNSYMPGDVASLVTTQLKNASNNQSASTLVAIVAILISLFSVSGATQNLINAVNASYERDETRNAIKLRLLSLGLLLGNMLAGAVVIGLLLMNEPLLESWGIPYAVALTISLLRWVVIAVIVACMLAVFYRYAPNRSEPQWQWVSWGSFIATFIWMVGTALFFIYARFFANFSESYSIFAGIIVLMTWFNLTAYIILLGAEINYRLEHQTILPTKKK